MSPLVRGYNSSYPVIRLLIEVITSFTTRLRSHLLPMPQIFFGEIQKFSGAGGFFEFRHPGEKENNSLRDRKMKQLNHGIFKFYLSQRFFFTSEFFHSNRSLSQPNQQPRRLPFSSHRTQNERLHLKAREKRKTRRKPWCFRGGFSRWFGFF